MNNYQPGDNSFITVNALGVIDRGPTKTGVLVKNSTLSGSISNYGAINAQSGITLESNAIAGGVSNSGTISASDVTAIVKKAIHLTNHSIVNGVISNSGVIENVTMGIALDGGSTANADISNSGMISLVSGGTFTGGIILFDSAVNGSISNIGRISADGKHGIYLLNHSSVSGVISNSGVIENVTVGIALDFGSTANADISNSGMISLVSGGTSFTGGILLSDSAVNGSISNSGTISGGGKQGIYLKNHSSVNGVISNNGRISAGSAIMLTNYARAGSISNSGTISAGEKRGIYLSKNSSVNGVISNSGIISASSAIMLKSNAVAGGIYNSGAIDANSGNGITANIESVISDSISNSGTIVAFTGIGIYTRSQVVGSIFNSGLIVAQSVGIISSSNSSIKGSIFNSGVITATAGSGIGIFVGLNSSIGGSISNSGSIRAVSTGIGIFRDSNITGNIDNSGSIYAESVGIAALRSSTIVGSILNSGTIQGHLRAINIDQHSVVKSIDIVGQTARIIGDVLAIGTTVNITSDAVFTSEGTFDVSRFNIESGALFQMANGITTSGTVDNSGTLSVATGTLETINGNYTQESTGVYQLEASNKENYAQLNATGQVNLSESGAINVQLQPGFAFHQGDVLPNVLSGTSLEDPTNGYNVTDNSFIWQFTAASNANHGVDLTIGINPSASSACAGSYCEGAASAIIGQVAAGNAIFNAYAALPSAPAIKTAASQATPELTNENIQVIQLVTHTVIDVLPMWSQLRGLSSGDAMLYQPGKVWLKPYGASMSQNQRNTVNGYTASVYGLVAGRDVALADHWMMGGALAAGGDRLRGKSVLNGQAIDSSQFQGILYASRLFSNNAYFTAQELVGYGNNNSERVIPLYSSTAKGNFNSWFNDLSAELGWSKSFNDRFVFTPDVNASYLYLNQGAYQEYGSLMDLNVQTNNSSWLIVGADANAAFRATTLKNQQDITLTGHAGVAYNLLNSQHSSIATFVAGGPSFSTYGIDYNGAIFRGGVGLTLANPTKPLSVNLNYDLQSGNNGYSGVYSATLKYKV